MIRPFDKLAIAALAAAATATCPAENPIIQTKFTADPAPMVSGDTVYLIASHDEDNAFGFTMYNWLCYSTTDMVNWTDHGIIGGVKEPYKTFKWADGVNAWAPQCIERNGKFYLYCPFPYNGGMAIGVAVADQPTGPFTDAIGKPLISRGNGGDYDPTVFVDNDGQAYLYWGGNGPCYYAKLNEDMISVSGEIQVASIDFTGARPEASYTEGPWFWREKNHYYLAWASRCCPEGIGYGMSDSPTGPWKCQGTIMDPNPRSSGNHPGILDYKGNSYVFGFNYALNFAQTSLHRERRSVCVERMNYNPDGTVQKVSWWSTNGVPQIGTFNPYLKTEAATICWGTGIKTTNRGEGQAGVHVTVLTNGAYIKLKGVNFGAKGAARFTASVASAATESRVELRLDSETGPVIGLLQLKATGVAGEWETKSCSVRGATGVHDLFFKFSGTNSPLMKMDWWQFQPKKWRWF
ncbi:MAG TPA: family 43 glycosylhydrolase [Verrucomicrobiae bacterium]